MLSPGEGMKGHLFEVSFICGKWERRPLSVTEAVLTKNIFPITPIFIFHLNVHTSWVVFVDWAKIGKNRLFHFPLQVSQICYAQIECCYYLLNSVQTHITKKLKFLTSTKLLLLLNDYDYYGDDTNKGNHLTTNILEIVPSVWKLQRN